MLIKREPNLSKKSRIVRYLIAFSLVFLLITPSNSQTANLQIPDVVAKCGDTIIIPVQVGDKDFGGYTSIQFSLTWNENALEFLKDFTGLLTPPLNLNPTNFGPNSPAFDNDTLTFVWFNFVPVNLQPGTTLFGLKFKVKGGGLASSQINFINQYTPIGMSGFVTGSMSNPFTPIPTINTKSGTVSINDTEAPVLVCPDDVTIVAPAGAGKAVVDNIYPKQASDNCQIAFLGYVFGGATMGFGQGDPSGTVFNSGISTVTYTINDANNNFNTCSFDIQVIDTASSILMVKAQKTGIDCSANKVSINITAQNFKDIAGLQFGLNWDENILQLDTITNLNPALKLIALGAVNSSFGPTPKDNDTLTFFMPTDPNGISLANDDTLFTLVYNLVGKTTCTDVNFISTPTLPIKALSAGTPIPFDIPIDTINGQVCLTDKTLPTIVCPKDTLVKVNQGQFSAIVNGLTPVTSDNCGVKDLTYIFNGSTPGQGNGDVSGKTFFYGSTNVTYTVEDFGGNKRSCTFELFVLDTVLRLLPTSSTAVCDSGKVSINVTAQNFKDIISLQFGMTWDPAVLMFDTVSNFDPNLLLDFNGNFGPTIIDDTLNFVWFNFQGLDLPDNTTLFTVNFKLLGNAGTQTKFEFISTPTTIIEASNTNGTIGVLPFDALINVFDFQDPKILCPSNLAISIPQGTTTTQIDNIAPVSVSDNCGIKSLTFNTTGSTALSGLNDASGNIFNIGATTVLYTVEDFGGNVETCSFVINVVPDTFLLYIDTIEAQCSNGVVAIDVKVKNFNKITSLQFGMDWLGALLKLDSISNLNPALNLVGPNLPGTNFGPDPMKDSLTFAWNNFIGVTLANGSTLFTIYLTPVTNSTLNTNVNFINYPTTPIEVSALSGIPFIIPYKIQNGVINITDTIPPVLICTPDITVTNDVNLCTATVIWTLPIATDNCDPLIDLSSTFTPGQTFALGTTTVTYTGKDDFNNVGTCSFKITVIDGQKPKITCPGNQTFENDPDECGATIILPPLLNAEDNCDLDLSITANQPLIKFYPVGGSTVKYTATDDAGNTATCQFVIIIKDMELPVLTDCPKDITVEPAVNINNLCFAEVTWTSPNASDNCPNFIVTNNINSGSLFPAGTTTVLYTVTDVSNNTATCSFNVSVQSFMSGFNDCPSDIVINQLQDTCGAFVSWVEPYFIDACGDTLEVYSNYGPGEFFPIGTTQITYISAANSIVLDTCTFFITVNGQQPFVVNCPGDIAIGSLPDTCGNYPTWDIPFVIGSCGDTLQLTSNNTPGSFLSVGSYTVIYSAPNLPGCAFNISIIDNIKPVHGLCPADQMIEVPDTVCGAFVSWSGPEFTDNCDDNLFIVSNHSPGEFFPTGSTIVTYVAIDNNGNVDTCSFEIFIREPIKPVLFNCPNDTTLTSLVNACGNFAFWNVPIATDNCDSTVSITANFAPGFLPVGSTTIVYTATDDSGNTSTCSFVIDVKETQAPAITCPNDIIIDGNGNIVSDPSNFIADVIPNDCNEQTLFFNQLIAIDNCVPILPAEQTLPSSPSNGEAFPAGNYNLTFTATDPSNNSSSCSFVITVLPYVYNAEPSITTICLGDTAVLISPVVPGATAYNWSGPNSFNANGPVVNVPVSSLNGEGQYIVNVILGNCNNKQYSDTLNIVIVPPADANDDSGKIGNSDTLTNIAFLNNDVANSGVFFTIGSISSGSVTLNPDNTLNYFPDKEYFGLATIGYKICLTDCPNVCDSATIRIDVVDDRNCFVPTLISPNGDDLNDFLYIKCIDTGKYNNNRIIIYNEWGDQVFEAAPYQNNWKGTLETTSGKNLPDGTYYFIFFESQDDNNPKYGYITILR